MTKKHFIKQLMSKGIPRNDADHYATMCNDLHYVRERVLDNWNKVYPFIEDANVSVYNSYFYCMLWRMLFPIDIGLYYNSDFYQDIKKYGEMLK
jgi:hypothetical protein